jgi:cytochrome P450
MGQRCQRIQVRLALYARLAENDLDSYRPDRWSDLPLTARSPAQPGLGNSMTFGFGPHSCLGYRFTIAEMKIFLAIFMSRFVFSPMEGVEISKFNTIMSRPFIRDKWELGACLPVSVGRYTR